MGKQSSRLIYQGTDHKDLFYDGKFHDKLYKGAELVWEKLYPDEFFVEKRDYYSGIALADVKEKYIDEIPYYGGIQYITLVGKALVAQFSPEGMKSDGYQMYFYAYSKDAVKWKKINLEPFSQPFSGNQIVVINDNSCAITYGNQSTGSQKWFILNFDINGDIQECIETEYGISGVSEPRTIANGYGKKYVFWRSEGSSHLSIDIVNTSGVVEESFKQIEHYELNTRVNLFNVQDEIWCVGAKDLQGYVMTVQKFDPVQGKFTTLKRMEDITLSDVVSMKVLYADEKEVVIFIYNLRDGNDKRSIGIYSITSAGFKEENFITFNSAVSIKNARTNRYAEIYVGGNVPSPTDGYSVGCSIAYYSDIYFKNKEFGAKKINGLCGYGMTHSNDEEYDEREAIVYFDNVYLKESSGNFFIIRGEINELEKE
ncbi:MAG: hypothetical protein HDR06_12140 [Lachnospiraceae bacterium]|nr:hypothetical protein [Lachnospiraceae bacterium]